MNSLDVIPQSRSRAVPCRATKCCSFVRSLAEKWSLSGGNQTFFLAGALLVFASPYVCFPLVLR